MFEDGLGIIHYCLSVVLTTERNRLLHDIAVFNIVWCVPYKMVAGTGGVYCAIIVQKDCNRVRGGGVKKDH